MKNLCLAVVLLLGGCAYANQTFDAQGRPATHISCGPESPSHCYRKANEVCPAGYYTLAEDMKGGWLATKATMTIRCK